MGIPRFQSKEEGMANTMILCESEPGNILLAKI